MHKVLIVEDEEIIRLGLKDNFELEGYDVAIAEDGEQALEVAQNFLPDLVILDLMLPKKSGFEVCRYLRKKFSNIYIIMLTAKTDEPSVVAGLEMGADDYVTKPFSILELLARAKSFLRRETSSIPVQDDILKFANIHIDFKKFTATKDSQEMDLSTKEFQILKIFRTTEK